LTPWRFVVVPTDKRELLAEAFALALIDRDPGATLEQIEAARDKAHRAPFVALAIVRLAEETDPAIPNVERIVPLGCAIQNLLLATHAMGFCSGLTRSLHQVRTRAQPVQVERRRRAGVLRQCRYRLSGKARSRAAFRRFRGVATLMRGTLVARRVAEERGERSAGEALDEALRSPRLRLAIALGFAVMIGLLIALGASLLDLPTAGVVLSGVLGGFRGAVYVLGFGRRLDKSQCYSPVSSPQTDVPDPTRCDEPLSCSATPRLVHLNPPSPCAGAMSWR
jgi:hypothetical protein